jgi:hypothetical protein
MIDNAIIQADLIAAIKAETTITSLLSTAAEIREASFMGADFAYPAVRVRIENNSPVNQADPCDHSELTFTVFCFTEEASSLTCQQLAAAVNNFFHRKYLTGTGYVICRIRSGGLSGPSPIGAETWMNMCQYGGTVRPTTAS